MVSREKGSLASMNKTYGKAGVFLPEVAASEILDLFGRPEVLSYLCKYLKKTALKLT
jgi:hypothetical protein